MEQHKFSKAYLHLLREFEGYYAKPYLCPAGYCTIGYGTNLEAHPNFISHQAIRENVRAGKMRGAALKAALLADGMVWTQEIAEEAMIWELNIVHADLLKRCKAYALLRSSGDTVRADALLDMGYNMGVGQAPDAKRGIKGCGLLGFHTTLPMIERGEYAKAAENLTKSKWYRQVGRRSKSVCFMLRTGTYPGSI